MQGRKTKAYICLFVCTTTRAVHLEVVDNLTATSFIMCLRRLAAAKGMPTLILSDNHRTFIAGETFLLDMQQDPSVKEYLASKNVRWKHQTPRSPWMDGHFERLVRTIKASLATAISRKLLTLEEFTTVVKEVENIVNSWPLTYQSDEIAVGLGEGSHPHASTPAARRPSRQRLRRQSKPSTIRVVKQRPRALSEAMAYWVFALFKRETL